MSDKFPKQYVLDRVAARRGSLTIKIDAGTTEINELKDSQLGKLGEVMEKNEVLIEGLQLRLVAARKAYAAAKTYDEKARALSPICGYVSLEQLPYLSSSNRASRTPLGEMEAKVQEHRKERTNLEHARLHLENMPVDEFSLASLKSLGLLNVLRFDLDEAARGAK